MATSLLFNINKYLLLEYIYESDNISTLSYPFQQIVNNYESNESIVVNSDYAITKTRNIIQDSVVSIGDGRYVVMDNTRGYFYPNIDNNVSVSNINFLTPVDIPYDKVRIHLLSGYDFPDLEGFITSIYARRNDNKILRLCNLFIKKNDTNRLFFNPKPLVLSEFVYDKYFEFLVPSQSAMLEQQELYPNSTTSISYYLTNGKYLSKQNSLYFEHISVDSISQDDNGINYLITGENIKFVFSSTDNFSKLVAKISENTNQNYFEYYASYDDSSIEDYIYRLNSVVGNKFYLIHNIRLIEQIGTSFIETENITKTQNNEYDLSFKYRPILRFADIAVSFSIEYTIRLYNGNDGRSVFKTSYLTSTNINGYNGKGVKLNVGNTTQPLKVYNKIQNNSDIQILDNKNKIITNTIITNYVSNNDIIISSNMDDDLSVEGTNLKLNPFDNMIKINLSKKTSSDTIIMKLDSSNSYLMVFMKDDGTKYYISEIISQSLNKNIGELMFTITSKMYEEIRKITSKNLWIVSRDNIGTETVLAKCTFSV